MGWTPVLSAASVHEGPLPNATLNDTAVAVSRSLHYLLLHKTQGKAVGIVRLCGAGEGLDAWRQLKVCYESMEGARVTGMLRFILHPKDRWMQDRDGGKDMEQSLNEWERLITDYEEQSLELVSDNIRVSTLLEHLPSPFREVLMQGPPGSRKT